MILEKHWYLPTSPHSITTQKITLTSSLLWEPQILYNDNGSSETVLNKVWDELTFNSCMVQQFTEPCCLHKSKRLVILTKVFIVLLTSFKKILNIILKYAMFPYTPYL
jgi:hypothetical protein